MWRSLYTQRFVQTSLLVFLLSVIAAIAFETEVILLVPFLVLALPYLFNLLVFETEKVFWLLLITLPISTEINFTPSLAMDLPDELLMMVLTGVFVVKLMVNKAVLSLNTLQQPIIFLLAVHLLWIFVSTTFSTDPALSFKYLVAKSWFIVPFVLLPQLMLNSKANIRRMVVCILLPMMLVVIVSLIRHSLLGFSFEGVKEVLSPFFRNHVNYSAFLACCLPVLWYANKLTPSTNRWKTYLRVSLFIAIVALIFAYSRGAWLAIAVAAVIAFIVRQKLMRHIIVASLIIVIFAVWWLATDNNYLRFKPHYQQTIFHTDIKQHLNATVELKDLSNAERFYRWVAGARMVAEKPVNGFGPNTFYNNYRNYTVNAFRTYVSDNPEQSYVHNYFLLLALEQGLPGVAFFCLLLFAMLLKAEQLYHLFDDRFYKTAALAIGVIISIIVTVNMLSDLVETDKIGSLFWLCLGMLCILDKKAAIQENRSV